MAETRVMDENKMGQDTPHYVFPYSYQGEKLLSEQNAFRVPKTQLPNSLRLPASQPSTGDSPARSASSGWTPSVGRSLRWMMPTTTDSAWMTPSWRREVLRRWWRQQWQRQKRGRGKLHPVVSFPSRQRKGRSLLAVNVPSRRPPGKTSPGRRHTPWPKPSWSSSRRWSQARRRRWQRCRTARHHTWKWRLVSEA